MAEVLLDKGYQVTGLVRGEQDRHLGAAEHLRDRVGLVQGELTDSAGIRAAIERTEADEIYHLAAPSFVPASWRQTGATVAAIVGSASAILEAVRDASGGTRVFIASSGAMFGDAPESPQREDTCCHPRTPYAIAKLA